MNAFLPLLFPIVLSLAMAPSLSEGNADPTASSENLSEQEPRSDWPMPLGNASRWNAIPFPGTGAISSYGIRFVRAVPYIMDPGPVIGDLDNDGVQEIVTASADNLVYVWKADGTLFWKEKARGWPQHIALAQLDGTGGLDVFANTGTPGTEVTAFDGLGRFLWAYPSPREVDWTLARGGPPLVADLLGDPSPELVVGTHTPSVSDRTKPHRFEVLDGATGRVAYANITREKAYGASAADLNGDGRLDLVGAAFRGGITFNTADGGTESYPIKLEIVILESNQAGLNLGGPPLWKATYYTIQNDSGWGTYSPPVLADVDGDGEIEIVFVSGSENVLTILDAAGKPEGVLPGAPADRLRRMRISVGDLDDDGTLEIVYSASNTTHAYRFVDGAFTLQWKRDMGEPIFGLVLGDLDNDGQTETIVSTGRSLHNPADLTTPVPLREDLPPIAEEGKLWILDSGGQPLWSSERAASILALPALADLEGDGTVEILVKGAIGRIYVFGEKNPAAKTKPLASLEKEADFAVGWKCERYVDQTCSDKPASVPPEERKSVYRDLRRPDPQAGNRSAPSSPEKSEDRRFVPFASASYFAAAAIIAVATHRLGLTRR